MSCNDCKRYVWFKSIPLQHSWCFKETAKIHGYGWTHKTKVISQTSFERGSTSIPHTTARMHAIVITAVQMVKRCKVVRYKTISA